jgi:putative membrane protein
MYHDRWNDGRGWSWIPMLIMMAIFWGGLVWLGITLLRQNGRNVASDAGNAHLVGVPPPVAPPVPRPTPQEILAERLARGEIEPDDYRQRIDALGHQRTTAADS